MSKWILPVAVALTIGLATVGAYGQSTVGAAAKPATAPHARHNSGNTRPRHAKPAPARPHHARHNFNAWRVWCKHHESCLHRYSWVARGNPKVRHEKWRLWCLSHRKCRTDHPLLQPIYILGGPTGDRIASLPEGEWVSTFMGAADAYGVSPKIMMGIGIIESGGGVAGTAYEGCMDSSTFGSWPGQIYCAAQVLARVGLQGYNGYYSAYPSWVMAQADGITITEK